MPDAKILIVEDEAIEAMDIQQRLAGLGYPLPDVAYNGEEGVKKVEEAQPDLVLMDIMMRGKIDGVAAAEHIRSRFDIPIIFLTAYTDENTLRRAKVTAPYGYIVKPFQERELHLTVDMALYRHKMERELREREKRHYDELEARVEDRTRELKDAEKSLRELNETLERRVAGRTGELQAANASLRDSRRAALNLMEDALMARRQAEEASAELRREVAERMQAEDRLRAAHAELERRACELDSVNRDLEAFSYTVSHDLKAPVRSIEGFSRALLEDCGAMLDSTGKDYLNRINAASLRMTQLIDAMLDMARLTQGQIHEKTVDLSALGQVIASELRNQDPERQVDFIIAEKMKVQGDSGMLNAALQNLLSNAWKYTSKRPAARIEFGVTELDGKRVHFIRDNGAGFDMEFADKLFMPFKRFHTLSEFPGLGIGLAIAHRIIFRHNGRIWAESAPGEGATFYFTL